MSYKLHLIGQAYFEWGYMITTVLGGILGGLAARRDSLRLFVYSMFGLLLLGSVMLYFKYWL